MEDPFVSYLFSVGVMVYAIVIILFIGGIIAPEQIRNKQVFLIDMATWALIGWATVAGLVIWLIDEPAIYQLVPLPLIGLCLFASLAYRAHVQGWGRKILWTWRYRSQRRKYGAT